MYVILTSEICGLCLILTLFILYRIKSQLNTLNPLLTSIFIGIAFFCILEAAWLFLNHTANAEWRGLNQLVTTLITAQNQQLVFCWFLFVEQFMNPTRWKKLRWILPSALLPGSMILLTFSSPFTGAIFTIDEQNVYTCGKWHFLQSITLYSYMLLASLHPFLQSFQEKNYVQKQKKRLFASFMLLPLLGAIMEMQDYAIPVVAPAITLSLTFIYITLREHNISLDALTHLNNRYRLQEYVANRTAHFIPGEQLYLVMIDLDKFKNINDLYGHVAGDKALCKVAAALQKTCNAQNCFLARYGGDEFIIIYEGPAIEQLLTEIQEGINEIQSTSFPYHLSVSCGSAAYQPDFLSVAEWLAAADAQMYANKQLVLT